MDFIEGYKEVASTLLKLEESHSNLEKAMSKLSIDIEEEKLLYRIAIKSALDKKIISKNKPLVPSFSKDESLKRFKDEYKEEIIMKINKMSERTLKSYRKNVKSSGNKKTK